MVPIVNWIVLVVMVGIVTVLLDVVHALLVIMDTSVNMVRISNYFDRPVDLYFCSISSFLPEQLVNGHVPQEFHIRKLKNDIDSTFISR